MIQNTDAYVQGIEKGKFIVISKYGVDDKRNFLVRLYGIGIPTLNQPFGAEAIKKLGEILPRGSEVKISAVSEDDNGIVTAIIQKNDRSINCELVDEGLAWVNRSECKAFLCRRWHIQESIAIKERKGVWSLNMSTPPWQWGE